MSEQPPEKLANADTQSEVEQAEPLVEGRAQEAAESIPSRVEEQIEKLGSNIRKRMAEPVQSKKRSRKRRREASDTSQSADAGKDGPTGGLTLDQLHGLGKAGEWGQALCKDLAAYRDGTLPWRDVDRGVLLVGPPGVGKTTFASVLATTCRTPLFATSYSHWQRAGSGHLGDVLKAMEKTFERAVAVGTSIVFLDEFDVFPKRDDLSGSNKDWWIAVVNALLEQLDGVADRNGVVVVAACNSMANLDPALVRAGRLDRVIEIGYPEPADLTKIYRHHLGADLAGVTLDALGLSSLGLSGADVESIVRRGRRRARHLGRELTLDDLFVEITGETQAQPADMLRRAAVHECGHVAAAYFLGVSDDISVSIIRRGDRGGATLAPPVQRCATRQALIEQVAVYLGGRAAEEVVLRSISAGAGGGADSDLGRATTLAVRMVSQLGLASWTKTLWLGAQDPTEFLKRYPVAAPDIASILDEAFALAKAVIEANRPALERLVQALLEKRALSFAQIKALLGERPKVLLRAARSTSGCGLMQADGCKPPKGTRLH
ncbi:MAG: AAA family ATPase [Hyphomicrobiaceae bacterium]|nr:AAA family ATPase [Hyphomicrobiaceae bacterium]